MKYNHKIGCMQSITNVRNVNEQKYLKKKHHSVFIPNEKLLSASS